MASAWVHGKRVYVKYAVAPGDYIQTATDYKPEQKDLARKTARALEDAIRKGEIDPDAASESLGFGPMTVGQWAKKWFAERAAQGKNRSQEYTVRKNVLRGNWEKLRLDEVRPRDIEKLIKELKPKRAPRTVRHIYSTLHTMFEDAVTEELIPGNPIRLKQGVLPPKEDKDPRWRELAIFSRDQIQSWIGDDRIDMRSRVLRALEALAGLRHGEAAGRRWRDYVLDTEPLRKLLVPTQYRNRKTKTGVARTVPVHPTLEAILDTWRTWWSHVYGREPRPNDFIVPDLDFKPMTSGAARKALLEELPILGIDPALGTEGVRHRRGHDLRHSFISLTLEDGAVPHILERVTHAKKKDVFNQYTRVNWRQLCDEVVKLRIEIPAWAKPAPVAAEVVTEAEVEAVAAHAVGAEASDIMSVPSGLATDLATVADNSAGSFGAQHKTELSFGRRHGDDGDMGRRRHGDGVEFCSFARARRNLET